MNRGDVIDPRSSDGTSSDQRRVHAVPPTPMYQGETNILDSLLKEAQLNPSLKASGEQYRTRGPAIRKTIFQ